VSAFSFSISSGRSEKKATSAPAIIPDVRRRSMKMIKPMIIPGSYIGVTVPVIKAVVKC
jgi:hypothetical protein